MSQLGYERSASRKVATSVPRSRPCSVSWTPTTTWRRGAHQPLPLQAAQPRESVRGNSGASGSRTGDALVRLSCNTTPATGGLQATRPQTLAYGLNDSPGRPRGLDRGEVQRRGPTCAIEAATSPLQVPDCSSGKSAAFLPCPSNLSRRQPELFFSFWLVNEGRRSVRTDADAPHARTCPASATPRPAWCTRRRSRER